jgi:uncharacterized phage protein (TIGR01671 family)
MEDRFLLRSWDKVLKEMHYYNMPRIYDMSVAFCANTHIECEPEELVFMQCTGLRDKNGTLMFEGDVVKTILENDPAFGGDMEVVGVVEWCEDSWWVKDVGLSYAVKNDDEIEIIGNIHDGIQKYPHLGAKMEVCK